ncbi:MAG: hypothetical protein AAB400_05060 [Patescibacteria group bacterium]
MPGLFGRGGKKDAPSRVWAMSDVAIAELLGDANACAELLAVLKKGGERNFFIPWSQWPAPAKNLVQDVMKMIEALPRDSRLFRVYVVPDDVASMCFDYLEWDDGAYHYMCRNLIYEDRVMEDVRKRLCFGMDMIEKHFKETGENASFNGVARCY